MSGTKPVTTRRHGPRASNQIHDGEGDVADRAAAWNAVEAATSELNETFAAAYPSWGEQLTVVRALYFASKPSAHAIKWMEVAGIQARLIDTARTDTTPAIIARVQALDVALAEYRRIGGSAQRAAGVGGLS